ncbi:MAG: hypothetical protein JWR05_2090 [Mucilaginibacter sp.]|nr:hypothetical protein [Mucilaginibacter sp.]
MKKNNIKLSVALNQAIEPIVRENFKLCKIEMRENYLLFLRDSELDSDFYFGIIKERTDSSGNQIIEYAVNPASSSNMISKSHTYNLDTFVMHFKSWFSNINFYSQDSILNDPILNGYKKEFYDDFRIMDDDADTNTFNYQQQLLLDRFLDNVIDNISELQNERNKEVIDAIIEDTIILQSELTEETKNGFMGKLSLILAKARKGGIKVSIFMLKEFSKEIFKESAKEMFDFAINHSSGITKYLHI